MLSSQSREITIAEYPFQQPQLRSTFAHVQKNTVIPSALAVINPCDPHLEALKDSINRGEPHDALFALPDADIYLFHLIDSGAISYWDGMTAYRHVMAAQQSANSRMATERLVADGVITQLGHAYLHEIHKKCQKFTLNHTPSISELEQLLLNLRVSEQWVSVIEYYDVTLKILPPDQIEQRMHSPSLAFTIAQNYPFTLWSSTKTNSTIFMPAALKLQLIIPSFTLIEKLHHLSCRNKVTMQPILGNINTNTLLKYHQHNIHPICIYSKRIKSNPIQTHGYYADANAQMLHDLGHTYWMSSLPKQFCDVVTNTFIPQLLNINKLMTSERDTILIDIIGLEQLNDFNLSPLNTVMRQGTTVETLMHEYMLSCFGIGRHINKQFSYQPNGIAIELCRSDDFMSQAEKLTADPITGKMWGFVISYLKQIREILSQRIK